ncbi:MAG: hypothetical protein C0412_19860, partial [Flavobacterium sp.]|nr:hypothetical protein [Flavobacterium sp.]
MVKSFYQAKTSEEAIELYFQGENELYAEIKNKVIKKILCEIYGKNYWNSLTVLEAGAGGGVWTEFFLKKKAEVSCVDKCEEILEGNKKLHPQAKFILADVTNVKLNAKFDLIFAKDVIEHIK